MGGRAKSTIRWPPSLGDQRCINWCGVDNSTWLMSGAFSAGEKGLQKLAGAAAVGKDYPRDLCWS